LANFAKFNSIPVAFYSLKLEQSCTALAMQLALCSPSGWTTRLKFLVFGQ